MRIGDLGQRPVATPSIDPAPSQAPRPTPSPTPNGFYTGPTFVGVSLQAQPGMSVSEARESALTRYGPVGVIRYFDPGLPNPWMRIRERVGDRPVAVSFKAAPSSILSGADDDALRAWFATAPRNHTTWWSYLPEPENDIERGEYTADEFRAAWRHVELLSRSAHNPRLRATLTLMCFTLSSGSTRHWQDYYPGGAYVDVIGWDCYNFAYRTAYADPGSVFGPALALSERLGKPWAIPETGSLLVPGDDGTGRAFWIRDLVDYARTNHAEFLTFFDAKKGLDYRLGDRASQDALRSAVSG